MSTKFPNLFTPTNIGNLTLKNRVIKAPQSTGMSNKDGSVSERLLRYYKEQAAGGTGLIVVEYAYVDNIASQSAHCQLGISTNEHIPGLAWLAQTIADAGSVPGIQIEHCGRQKFLATQPIWAPSAVPWPKILDMVGMEAVPHVMTQDDINFVVDAFAWAAWRAKMAGFELVEIHGAHGYLLTNFFSPHTNYRNDWYGGSIENRSRIYVDIVRAIRAKVGPDYPVTIRLSGTDYEPDGFPIEDTIWLAKRLEQEGIDAFHISGGDHPQMIHQVTPGAIPVCHNVWAAEAVKKEVSVPVIASGSITLPAYAEDIIASGQADMVGLGRPLFADPDWTIKAEQDRPEDIRPCIRCNEGCLERTFFKFQAVACTVNPVLSREESMHLTPATTKKNVAVVGGGPAGLEAARVAKLRGHDVTLYERGKLGGRMNEAAVPDFKSDLIPLINNMVHQVQSLGIPVVAKDVTAADLTGQFDEIVVAVGAEEIAIPVPGADKPNVVKVTDVINEVVKPSGKVVMIGGGLVGIETALDLNKAGYEVTVVEMLDNIMTGAAFTDLVSYGDLLAESSVVVLTKTRLLEIRDGSVLVQAPTGKQEIPADTVIMAVGYRPRTDLKAALVAAGNTVHTIGDAVKAGKIMDAIHTGYRVGMNM